jgi:rSAM/selenodomain-associated transferase 2/rSAM/selenodomain-associated transferase 1
LPLWTLLLLHDLAIQQLTTFQAESYYGKSEASMKFSVIIPTLNEAQTIQRCIDYVSAIGPGVEIIVADGGSTDNTAQLAQESGAVVCHSQRGKGPQLNAGAAIASGDVMLFLHADTHLPANAFDSLGKWFNDENVQVGSFRATFDVEHWLLDYYHRFNRFDSVITRYGDQCIVARKSFFNSMGGFPEWPLFEDVHFLRMARRRTRICSFPEAVTTSARRFVQNGVIVQILRDAWYIAQYLLGASVERLAQDYEQTEVNRSGVSIIIFARFPVPGRVKTRLAKRLGEEAAAEFYRLCAEHVFRVSRKVSSDVNRYLFYSDKCDVERIRHWAGRRFYYAAQADRDLGERIEQAFTTVFSHGAQKAIILATDVPDLSAKTIDDAVSALDSYDVVVGPCRDGGYYLLGLKKLYKELFVDVPWSTDQVLNHTLSVIKSLGLTVRLLPVLTDIDTEEDLLRWCSEEVADSSSPVRDFVRSLGCYPLVRNLKELP